MASRGWRCGELSADWLGADIVCFVEDGDGLGGQRVPERARLLHERGRAAGEGGDYEHALASFAEARVLAPGWAYPVYDAAFTHLLMGDTAGAEELYAEVDRMEPRGFHTCKSTLAMVRRERAGELFAGFSRAWLQMERLDANRKRAVAEGVTRRYPSFAPAWRELAKFLEDPATGNARSRPASRPIPTWTPGACCCSARRLSCGGAAATTRRPSSSTLW
jgi:tetratricopeptide (TPR) repeat protein